MLGSSHSSGVPYYSHSLIYGCKYMPMITVLQIEVQTLYLFLCRYKFSWSPKTALEAVEREAKWLEHGEV